MADAPLLPDRKNGVLRLQKLMTVSDVAEVLQVSPTTVRRAIGSGKLEVFKIGKQGQIRVSGDQLERYLALSANSKPNCQSPGVPSAGKGMTAGAQRNSRDEGSAPSAKPSGRPRVNSGKTDADLSWKVIQSDAQSGLSELPAESVNCIVTSPPYYWQRDYEVSGQIGHEATIQGYVDSLRDVFRAARRTLKEDGVLFLNIGDTYYSAKGKPHGRDRKHRQRQLSRRVLRAVDGPGLGVPRKSLIGIPWRVALALQDDGWVLRSSIIWRRPSAMPEPTAHDRPWRTHEPVFLFSKSPRYWFNRDALGGEEDIWKISVHSRNPAAHFAPYPVEFAERCVTAGCPEGGTVLDPFVGSGTTMIAALNNGMSAVGIDLKEQYCEFVSSRIREAYCLKRDSARSDVPSEVTEPLEA